MGKNTSRGSYRARHFSSVALVQMLQAACNELIPLRIGHTIVTSNQPFSGWEGIFPDSTMTVAATDRLVHHSIILDIQAQSFRKRFAEIRNNQ